MSQLSITNLSRIPASKLKDFILNPSISPSFAVIDVRDADYLGGHIRGSQHVPSSTHAVALPELVRTLKEKQVVVVHCMLCQQRGPKAALEYARTRERLLGENGKMRTGSVDDVEGSDGGEVGVNEKGQWVGILDSGFAAWQQAGYGEDERLTEGFDKRLWDDGGFD